MSGLKTSSLGYRHEEENCGINGQSLLSKGRLVTPHNNKKENPSLPGLRKKPYMVDGQRIDRLASRIVFTNKLAMEASWKVCLQVKMGVTYFVKLVWTPLAIKSLWSMTITIHYILGTISFQSIVLAIWQISNLDNLLGNK